MSSGDRRDALTARTPATGPRFDGDAGQACLADLAKHDPYVATGSVDAVLSSGGS